MAEQQYTAEDIGLLVAALREGIYPTPWFHAKGPMTWSLDDAHEDDRLDRVEVPIGGWPDPIAALIAAARALGLQAEPLPGIPPEVAAAAVPLVREQASGLRLEVESLEEAFKAQIEGGGDRLRLKRMQRATATWSALLAAIQGQAAPSKSDPELDKNEVALLLSLVSERIMQADESGTPRTHKSSVFRERLLNKLIAAKVRLAEGQAAPCLRCGGTGERRYTEYTPGGHPMVVVDVCPGCKGTRVQAAPGQVDYNAADPMECFEAAAQMMDRAGQLLGEARGALVKADDYSGAGGRLLKMCDQLKELAGWMRPGGKGDGGT